MRRRRSASFGTAPLVAAPVAGHSGCDLYGSVAACEGVDEDRAALGVFACAAVDLQVGERIAAGRGESLSIAAPLEVPAALRPGDAYIKAGISKGVSYPFR